MTFEEFDPFLFGDEIGKQALTLDVLTYLDD
jgi:hypothetical protein